MISFYYFKSLDVFWRVEVDSQSLDVDDSDKKDEEDTEMEKKNEHLKRTWKESIISILSSLERLFSFEDLYALENELIIRVFIKNITSILFINIDLCSLSFMEY